MKTWVVGVNWWMTDYMRLMFNYAQSDLSGYPTTPHVRQHTCARAKERLRRRDDQRLRHARPSRLVKLEKRNISPLRCQTAAPNRAAVFFAADSLAVRRSHSNCLLPHRHSDRGSVGNSRNHSNALTRASTGLHCVGPEAILDERRYLDAKALAIAGLMAALSFGSGAGVCLPGDAGAAARRDPASRTAELSRSSSARPMPRRPLRKPNSGGLNLFGYTVLPKLNFGLDVLYGQDEQQLQLGGTRRSRHARREWRRQRPRQGQAPLLGHDPETWHPVFRTDHAPTESRPHRSRHIPMIARLGAASVHLLTASGAVLALLALRAVHQGDWQMMFVWLGVALIVDAVDGPLARRLDGQDRAAALQRRAARPDRRLSHLCRRARLCADRGAALAGAARLPAAAAILLSSLFHVADLESKTEEGYFVGFPAIWNIVLLYLFALGLPPYVALAVVALFVLATFVPILAVHPFRVARLRPLTCLVTAALGRSRRRRRRQSLSVAALGAGAADRDRALFRRRRPLPLAVRPEARRNPLLTMDRDFRLNYRHSTPHPTASTSPPDPNRQPACSSTG